MKELVMTKKNIDRLGVVCPNTLAYYDRLIDKHFSAYESEYGEKPYSNATRFIDYLKKRVDGQYSKSTLRSLKAAIRYGLNYFDCYDFTIPDFIPGTSEASARGQRRKTFPMDIANAMKEKVFSGKRYDNLARLGVMMTYSSIFFGLRPSEWFSARLTNADTELVIINAKYSPELGRSFGPSRTILIGDDLPVYVLDGMKWVIDEIQRLGLSVKHPDEVTDVLRQSLANSVARVYDAVMRDGNGGKIKKVKNKPRCTMYSARHQFAANAKNAGLSQLQIAALMGHSSIETAGTHYGRRRHGTNGFHVSPHDEDIEAVEKMQKKIPQAIPSFVFNNKF